MADRIIIQIRGGHVDRELVRLKDMLDELSAIQGALIKVDQRLSGRKKGGSAYYRIVKMSTESPAVLEIESVPVKPDFDFTDDITAGFLKGVDDIYNDREPAGLDYADLEAFSKIGKTVGKTTAEVSIQGNGALVSLQDGLKSHVKRILGKPLYYTGSVSGLLQYVDIHGEANKFFLYPVSGTQRVECHFSKKDVREVLRHIDRYLKVTGRLKYYRKATHAHEVNVDQYEVFPEESDLPKFSDLRGIAPNATGQMTSTDFINKLREDG